MTAGSSARHALLVALISLAVLKFGALLLCPELHCRVPAFDSDTLIALHAWRSPALDGLFAALTWAGSLYVLLPLAVLTALLDTRAAPWWQRAFVPLALLSTWAVVHAAKLMVARPRPNLFETLIAMPGDGSYPSAHAAQAAAFALAWLLRPGTPARPLAGIALGLAVLTVGLSRLYLQVHYPSDVLFALAASGLWVVALRLAWDAAGARA